MSDGISDSLKRCSTCGCPVRNNVPHMCSDGSISMFSTGFSSPKYLPNDSGVTIPISSNGMTLPTDSDARKDIPIVSGCIKYFPAALAGVAKISKAGNDKHNPGQPLHHARGKSTDHADCIVRHLIDVNDLIAANADQEKILLEVSQMCWRALALSQELHESFGAPLAPGAKNETK